MENNNGKTNFCSHETSNTSGICDFCLGKWDKKDKPLPTQEPMEWGESLKKEFHKFSLETANDVDEGRLDYEEVENEISDWWLAQIKQAEERHNQDCTREEWKENIEQIVKAGYDSMLDQKLMEARAEIKEELLQNIGTSKCSCDKVVEMYFKIKK